MAITTELVGILGGGRVSTLDVNFANPSANGTYDVITVPIPSGVPHLVALEMKTIKASGATAGNCPNILFNDVNKGAYSTVISSGDMAGVFSSAVTIRVQKNSSLASYSAAFTGTVYYCPLGS